MSEWKEYMKAKADKNHKDHCSLCKFGKERTETEINCLLAGKSSLTFDVCIGKKLK